MAVLPPVGLHVLRTFRMKTVARRGVWGTGLGNSTRLDRVAREALFDIAGRRRCTVDDLLLEIERERRGANFAAATRSYVVAYYRARMQAALRGNAERVA